MKEHDFDTMDDCPNWFDGCHCREAKAFTHQGTRERKNAMSKRVFLGGTCNESTWRNRMMGYLCDEGMEYFNPVVDDWDDNAMANELRERETCDFCLYVITPVSDSVFSIAEVVDDSNKRPEKTVFVLLRDDGKEKFTPQQWKHLGQVAKMVKRNGGMVFDSLKHAAVEMGAWPKGKE